MRFILSTCLALMLFASASIAEDKVVGFDDHDGDFSATITAVDPQELEEFLKPSDQGVRLTVVSRVTQGQSVAFPILFMGIALDDQGKCDVVYDIKLLDPKGHVSGAIDRRNIIALRREIPDVSLVFHSQEVVGAKFDASDPAGMYKVVATIRDNIGKKTVAVSHEFELVK